MAILTTLLLLADPTAASAVDGSQATVAGDAMSELRRVEPASTDSGPDRVADHVGGVIARLRDGSGESIPGDLYLLMATVGSEARARLFENTPFEHDGGEHADTNAANAAAAELAADVVGVSADRIEFTSAPGGGPSGGLVYAIAYLNVLTDGEFTGGLRIAATGAIVEEGYLEMVQAIDEKLGAADLADVDVLLTTSTPSTPRIEAHTDRKVGQRSRSRDGSTRIAVERGLGDYERWGATRPDGLDLVVVGHIADVAAYLCGTGSIVACTFAETLGRAVTSDPHASRPVSATSDVPDGVPFADTVAGTIS